MESEVIEDKSFVEYKGEKPFNWYLFLSKESYTFNELINAKNLANDWITCACGQQCSIIPRAWQDNGPKDTELRDLGTDFYRVIRTMGDHNTTSVIHNNQNHALLILEQIEERSFFLIYEELKSRELNK